MLHIGHTQRHYAPRGVTHRSRATPQRTVRLSRKWISSAFRFFVFRECLLEKMYPPDGSCVVHRKTERSQIFPQLDSLRLNSRGDALTATPTAMLYHMQRAISNDSPQHLHAHITAIAISTRRAAYTHFVCTLSPPLCF